MVPGRQAVDDIGGQARFQRQPQVVEVGDVLSLELDDLGALPGAEDHQPLAVERLQCLAYGHPADTEVARELFLVDRHARRPLAAAETQPQLLGDLLGVQGAH